LRKDVNKDEEEEEVEGEEFCLNILNIYLNKMKIKFKNIKRNIELFEKVRKQGKPELNVVHVPAKLYMGRGWAKCTNCHKLM